MRSIYIYDISSLRVNMYDIYIINMEILLAVFTGMTTELLIGNWHGGGGTEKSVEEEVIT